MSLTGLRERLVAEVLQTSGIGDEMVLNYVFGTAERTYAFRVTIRKDAREKWAADLKRCLESFKLVAGPK